mgnify:CR=1 FL=1
MLLKKGIRLLSLFVIFFGASTLIHADKGFITVDGKNIEMDVERQYQAPASYPRKALRLAKEGYVIVEFDVSADGDVIDPFVLDCLLYTSDAADDP